MKQLKEQEVYRNFCALRGNNLGGRVEMPRKFQDVDTCLKWIRPLDEAHMYIRPQLFESYDPIKLQFSADYLALHGRSMFKPIVEIWGFNLAIEQMSVGLNSRRNSSLFQTEAISRIYNRFPLSSIFNKLPSRFYYKLDLDMQKLNVSIQG